jgi:hypothetical protein
MIVEYIDQLGVIQRARQANEGEITMARSSEVNGGYQMFLTHGELMKIPVDEVED